MSAFKDAAKRYLTAQLGHEITDVEIEYDEGYNYSSYTFADPSFTVTASCAKDYCWHTMRDQDAGEFLKNLLAWEDE